MSKKLMLVLALSACAPSQEPADSAEDQPVIEPPASTPLAVTEAPPSQPATPDDTATTPPEPKPVPPLSSPNATAKPAPPPAADAGASGDPRTEALRRVGTLGQRCHEKTAPGVNGNLVLQIVLKSDGSIDTASVVKERSTAALAGGALEKCVLEGVKKEKFPAPSGGGTTLDVPLSFKPGT